MSSPIVPANMLPFAPSFLFPFEYAKYGLPDSSTQPDIDNLVTLASAMVDEYCGRTDGDSSGSLVYTTYQERILSQSPGRNINYLPHRPLASIGATQQNNLMASGFAVTGALSQPYYTGWIPSQFIINPGPYGPAIQSAIVAASGRYAFPRRDTYPMSNDPYAFVNPLTIITLFGGPPPWVAIDMTNQDYDPQTGEIWFASGMWLERYTECIVTYNSGYDPTNIPYKIKLATAAIVKNLMMRGSGTTGMSSFTLGKTGISALFTEDVIDSNIQRLLQAFVTIRAY